MISPAGNCRVTQDAPGPPRVDAVRQSNSYVAFMNGWVIQARIPMPRCVFRPLSFNRCGHRPAILEGVNDGQREKERIYQALKLSEQAHEVHLLPYAAGLSHLEQFRPDRFEWICEQTRISVSIKLRDKRSGAVANWPHWAG